MRKSIITTGTVLALSFVLTGCGGGGDGIDSAIDASAEFGSAKSAAVAGTLPALPTDAIFAPTSFWYQKIPTSTQLHPNTAGFVTEFLRLKTAYHNTVSISMESWSSPVYVVPSNIAVKQVKQLQCIQGLALNPGLAQQWAEVPVPDYAQSANGTDAEMTVYQPSTDTLWEFWKAKNTNGQWVGCWGGKMQNVSQSDGRWPTIYGTTATGLPFLGGQVTAEELTRGEIRHAIGISLPEAEAAIGRSWPATRSDGTNLNNVPNRIPQGLRFRLDPSVNVDLLKMKAAGKVIAKAAQVYGFVVWDTAGTISIRSQNPKTYTAAGQPNPYPALFDNAPQYTVLAGFPWDKLQFMPMDYGKP